MLFIKEFMLELFPVSDRLALRFILGSLPIVCPESLQFRRTSPRQALLTRISPTSVSQSALCQLLCPRSLTHPISVKCMSRRLN